MSDYIPFKPTLAPVQAAKVPQVVWVTLSPLAPPSPSITRERDPQTGWTVLWVSGPEALKAELALLTGPAPIFYTLERERLSALSPAGRLVEYRRRLAAQQRKPRARG